MPFKADAVSVEWIASNDDLRQAVARFGSVIGLDTEFIRTDTFYPQPGLYQVCALAAEGHEVFLIDPLAIDEWDDFASVLADEGVTKIMHACQEDLELMHHHLNIDVRGVFDTQFANAYLSEDFSLSYANLVSKRLQVDLPKHATRSNWLQRPLTDEQISYAVEDVTYLFPLFDAISEGLGDKARTAWLAEDLPSRTHYAPQEPSSYYQGVRKAWQLDDEARTVLATLCQWREETARRLDIPRNRVVWDEHLMGFACKRKLSAYDINESLPRGIAKRHAEGLLNAHAQGKGADTVPPVPVPLTTREGVCVKELKKFAATVADKLGMAQELLSRKKDLEACVRHYKDTGELSPWFAGWRAEYVDDAFHEALLRMARES